MTETAPLHILLMSDSDRNERTPQLLTHPTAQNISTSTAPISELYSCSLDDVDIVIVDIEALVENTIDPAELGDILYYHVPVVLVGQDAFCTKAMDGIRAGAQCWLPVGSFTQRPLYDVLLQAKSDFEHQRDLVVNHAKYRAVVEDQSELICRFLPDSEFTLTFVNQAYAAYLGHPAADLEGQSLLRHTLKKNQSAFIKEVRALTPQRAVTSYDCYEVIDKDIYWTQWTNKAIFDSNGVMLEVQSIGVDVTARRCAEQRALERESNFQSFFQEVPILMQELDPKGWISNVNRCWCETMGYERDEVIDTHFYRYLLRPPREQARFAYKTLLNQRWVKDIPCSFIKRNGEMCKVLLSATAEFDTDKELQRFLVVSVVAPVLSAP